LGLVWRKGLRMELQSGRSARILVVDDDPSSAEALAALLQDEGHETAVARSGAEAMTALDDGRCRLLLLDPALRDRSGLELLHYAKERGVPTIVTTSDPVFDPERMHQNGVGRFLYKPLRLAALLGLITTVLDPGRPD
jgi:two-component system, NtrC family, response regulator GlrR